MNRAQRRQKQSSRHVFNKYGATKAINTLLVKFSTAAQDDGAYQDLMARAYAALEALTGTATSEPWLTEDLFIDLNESNVFGFELAALLYKNGTANTKAIIAPLQKTFEGAADALAAIGERYQRVGKYRANGDELQTIRASFNTLDNLVQVSTQGITLSALIKAKTLVQKAIQ